MDKRVHSPKKGDLGIFKNYQSITFISKAAKIYNALLSKHIEPEIEEILLKNQNSFGRNRSITSQILTIHQILEVRAENLEATLLFVDFSKAFDSIYRGRMEEILLAYGVLKETVTVMNDALQKHGSKSLLTRWRHRLLWHCCWCSVREYISIVPVHNLSRVHTSNVDRTNERKWFSSKKSQEADYSSHKVLRAQTTQIT